LLDCGDEAAETCRLPLTAVAHPAAVGAVAVSSPSFYLFAAAPALVLRMAARACRSGF
jgi:hypothetical protein